MYNRGRVVLGAGIVVFGLLLLVANLLDVDLGVVCWPAGLILLGLALLLRPWMVGGDIGFDVRLLGDIRRRGRWQVLPEELWIGVGNVTLDLSEADAPLGETTLRCFGFVGDVRVVVPEGIGLALSAMYFVTTVRIMGKKRDAILTPVRWVSDGYEAQERRIRLEIVRFVGDIKVSRP